MVKINRVYTRSGDDGTTGLGDGSRVPKTDIRVEAYGTVDEANAFLGVCVARAGESDGGVKGLLESIQQDLFDVGADLCCPVEPGEQKDKRIRVRAAQVERVEKAIDRYNEGLAPLNSFVLPGGSELSCALHAARTVVRRAERRAAALLAVQSAATNPETVRYLNRLSDLLFVLARWANSSGEGDVLWVPGANREG